MKVNGLNLELLYWSKLASLVITTWYTPTACQPSSFEFNVATEERLKEHS